MADLRLVRPALGQRSEINAEADSRIVFDFSIDEVVMSRVEDESGLIFTFDDGSSIVIANFYDTYSSYNMPDFVIGDQIVEGDQFFAAFDENLMPAAGPADETSTSDGSSSSFENNALSDGVTSLGGLDINSDSSEVDLTVEETTRGLFVSADDNADQSANAGVGTITPSSDGDTNPPDDDGKVTPPVGGGETTPPDSGETTPPDSGETTPPPVEPDPPVVPEITTITLSADKTGNLEEGSGSITYTVTASNAAETAMTVKIDIDGTVHEVTIAEGKTTGTVTFGNIRADDVYKDANDTISANIVSSEGGNYEGVSLDKTPISTNITDTIDTTTITLKAPDSIDVDATNVQYTISVDNAPQSTLVVAVLVNGVKQEVTIEAGSKLATFDVAINDTNVAKDGTITVVVDNHTGGNYENTEYDNSDGKVVTAGTILVDEGIVDGGTPDTTAGINPTWQAPEGFTIDGIPTATLGTVSVDTKTGTLTYTLNDAIDHDNVNGENVKLDVDTITVTLKDANGDIQTVEIAVNVQDDVPTIAGLEGTSGTNNSTLSDAFTIDFGADGADGAVASDSLGFSIVVNGNTTFLEDFEAQKGLWSAKLPDGGTIIVRDTGNGDFKYTVSGDDLKAVDFTLNVTAQDTDGKPVSQSVNISVSDTVPTLGEGSFSQETNPNLIDVNVSANFESFGEFQKVNTTESLETNKLLFDKDGNKTTDAEDSTFSMSSVKVTIDKTGMIYGETEAYGEFGYRIHPKDDGQGITIMQNNDTYIGGGKDWADKEIGAGQANQNTGIAEGVLFELSGGKESTSITLELSSFFKNYGASTKDLDGEGVEELTVYFYKDGKAVGNKFFHADQADGTFTIDYTHDKSFDQVYVIPNFPEGAEYSSSFLVNAVTFNAVLPSFNGKVDFDFGDDNNSKTAGIAFAVPESNTINSSLGEITVSIGEASNGDSTMTGTDSKGSTIFEATLNQNGEWKLEQSQDFKVGENNNEQFELDFKITDSDGSTIEYSTDMGSTKIDGTDADNTVLGDAENNTMKGKAGNDSLFGDAGDDIIFGGDGNDYLMGGTGADKLYGGSGHDIIRFDSGDTVDGGEGIDFAIGGILVDQEDMSATLEGLDNIDMLITSRNETSLTDLTSLGGLEDIGITINADGSKGTLSDSWTRTDTAEVTTESGGTYHEYEISTASGDDVITALVNAAIFDITN